MSIANEIARIQTDRDTMRTKLVNLGLVQSTANLDDIAEAVDSINNRGAVSAQVSVATPSYIIPVGYHNGSGKVSVAAETKTATPTKATQDITPTSGKVLSKVTVNPIPAAYQDVTKVTATANKVLTGSKFVDADGNVVEGTMPDRRNGGGIIWNDGYITVKEGYHIETESDIPVKYQDVTSVTATAATVLTGYAFVDKTGASVSGTMANNGSTTKTFDGLSTTSVTIPAGYTSGGTVSLTSDIETALAAI